MEYGMDHKWIPGWYDIPDVLQPDTNTPESNLFVAVIAQALEDAQRSITPLTEESTYHQKMRYREFQGYRQSALTFLNSNYYRNIVKALGISNRTTALIASQAIA